MALWRVWLAFGTGITATYLLLPDQIVRDIVYAGLGLGSVVAILIGVRRHASAPKAAWYLFAAGLFSWSIGDSIYSWNADVRHTVPFPSAADVFYLIAYPLLAAGIAVLIRRRGAQSGIPGMIDSAIVVAGLGLVSWTWIARPMLAAEDVSAFERWLAVAYPAGDIILVAMLVLLVSAIHVASAAFRLLVGAALLQITADTALAAAPSASWDYSSTLDLLWLGSYVLWGAAALHPQMGELSRRDSYARVPFTRRRLAALSAAALLPSVMQLAAASLGRPVDTWAVVGGSIVLTSLVLARMACAIGEIRVATKQRDRLQEELFDRAAHDPQTGLLNRAFMMSLIDGALRRGRGSGSPAGLLVVDLDGLTTFREEWAPQVGDGVLIEAARRISATSGQHPVARLGDDQFVVLVEDSDAENESTRLAERLVASLRKPYDREGRLVDVMARVGLTVSLDAGADAGRMLQEALIAARRTSGLGADSFGVFDAFMRQAHASRAETESSLREALRDGNLELYYQPVVAALSGGIDGYEALVRWNEPDGIRLPADFIPVAERSDLICDIGRWALTESTRQFASWIAAEPERFGDLTVAVNISGRHLGNPSIVDDVLAALDASGLAPHHLTLEVTETVILDVTQALLQLTSLRDIGVTISLDDFGTGFTSVSQLRRLPIDTVKIDKSFFESDDPGSAELIALMTGAAHACGLLVIAEGIERLDQVNELLALDCDAAQGFFFSPPMPADDVLAYRGREASPLLRVVKDHDGNS